MGEDDPTDDYELDELIDSSVTLGCWVDQSGRPAELIVTSVGDGELGASTPTADLAPWTRELLTVWCAPMRSWVPAGPDRPAWVASLG